MHPRLCVEITSGTTSLTRSEGKSTLISTFTVRGDQLNFLRDARTAHFLSPSLSDREMGNYEHCVRKASDLETRRDLRVMRLSVILYTRFGCFVCC
ncbi:hypothetical protein NPIL_648181 [Nephila pilipes]|uniref:Uncharacterized protein n=1 Tax=Nephila pilipes TaxID=299642 RepID=A0A8X6TW51_NEPPI|nr:hypothetical protein NPIL_648181 [Nephila pilipes]